MPGRHKSSRQVFTLLCYRPNGYGFVLLFCTLSNSGIDHNGHSRLGNPVPVCFGILGKRRKRSGSRKFSILSQPWEYGNSEDRFLAACAFVFFWFSQLLPFSPVSVSLSITYSTVQPNARQTRYRIIADGFVFFPFSRNRMYRSVVPDSSASRDWENFFFFRNPLSLP